MTTIRTSSLESFKQKRFCIECGRNLENPQRDTKFDPATGKPILQLTAACPEQHMKFVVYLNMVAEAKPAE